MNKTIEYFLKLTQIPRPSGHEEKVKNFLITFAKERNLQYYTDKFFNVIIKKKSNIKDCNKTLILQAHTDMVCESNSNVNINFLTDPIKTKIVKESIKKDDVNVEEEFIKADGTTLGADNGIGLSMILSILDDNSLLIPNLECVFTSQEETTMLGAINLDTSLLQGKSLLSLDGTKEGFIDTSCAGMITLNCKKQFETLNDFTQNNQILTFNLSGLSGGHSGEDINKNKQNSIKLLFEFLSNLSNPCNIVSVSGGNKANAIPRECKIVFLAHNLNETALKNNIENFIKKYKSSEKDINLTYKIDNLPQINDVIYLSDLDSKNLINYVNNYQNGVLFYSKSQPDFPIVSNNFAKMILENGKLDVVLSLRSSNKNLEHKYLNDILNYSKEYNFDFLVTSSAPFFEENKNSVLTPLCLKAYKKLFNKNAVAQGVHAGLEGGVFYQKIPNVDICVIAADLYDIHSPNEKVSINSVNRTYLWLEEIIKNFTNA